MVDVNELASDFAINLFKIKTANFANEAMLTQASRPRSCVSFKNIDGD